VNLSQEISKIDRSIPATNFHKYAELVDELCKNHIADATEMLGATSAQLMLLKVSNLLVAKYEYMHRHTAMICHPVGFLIDPCNGCNLRCPGCVHSGAQSDWDWPSGILKEEVFRSFLDEHGPFAFELYLANYGEPLLSKLTPKFAQIARQYCLPTFSSTSLSVPPRMLDGLVESGINFLIISIDGATEDIYLRYRRKGNFDQVIANVKQLVETKRRLNSYTPVLHWQFLVFEHNVHQIESVTQLARELGVNQLALVKPFSVDWDDPFVNAKSDQKPGLTIFHHDRPVYRTHLEKMRADLAEENIARHFAVTWVDRLRASPLTETDTERYDFVGSSGKPCNWLYKSLTMDAHGRIMPCARPPTTNGDLVFARHTDKNQYRSPMHLLARQIFRDPGAYHLERPFLNETAPYCERCEHRTSKADIDTRETVRQLFHDVYLFDAIDPACKNSLTDW
jgi:MoaA/NifB/PqqE/SkfB family radical SAM enzyme